MHLYLLTRGIKKEVDDMIVQLQGKYLPKGDGEIVQVGVRPVQLWELFFPEEQLDTVLNTLQPSYRHEKSLAIKALRKGLKAKKVPKYDPKAKVMPMYVSPHVEIVPLGIREDPKDKDGNEML